MQRLGGKPQKKLQNKGLNIRPALRTLSHQWPDPPPEGKTGTAIPAAVAEIPSLCPRAFPGEKKVLQEDKRANHAPKSLPCSAMQTFKVLRARMKLGSCFQQDKEKPELVQVLQAQKKVLRMERDARTEEPSPGFGDSRDADCLWRGFCTSAVWGCWDSPKEIFTGK